MPDLSLYLMFLSLKRKRLKYITNYISTPFSEVKSFKKHYCYDKLEKLLFLKIFFTSILTYPAIL